MRKDNRRRSDKRAEHPCRRSWHRDPGKSCGDRAGCPAGSVECRAGTASWATNSRHPDRCKIQPTPIGFCPRMPPRKFCRRNSETESVRVISSLPSFRIGSVTYSFKKMLSSACGINLSATRIGQHLEALARTRERHALQQRNAFRRDVLDRQGSTLSR